MWAREWGDILLNVRGENKGGEHKCIDLDWDIKNIADGLTQGVLKGR